MASWHTHRPTCLKTPPWSGAEHPLEMPLSPVAAGGTGQITQTTRSIPRQPNFREWGLSLYLSAFVYTKRIPGKGI